MPIKATKTPLKKSSVGAFDKNGMQLNCHCMQYSKIKTKKT